MQTTHSHVRRSIAVIVGTIALTVSGFSAASAQTAAPGTGPGTGPQPPGLGLGSKEALSQKNSAPNGHTNFNFVGGGPFCVNPWPAGKDNGGATAPGVTKTSVKVVVYIPTLEMISASGGLAPKNAVTGQTATPTEVFGEWQTVYDYIQKNLGTYQLWGRTPDIEMVTASGSDETAQRADAVAVIAKKPFMVYDVTGVQTGGAAVFTQMLAARKIVVASASVNSTDAAKLSPYLWNYGADPDADPTLTAAFVSKSLAGDKAKWAGDTAYQSKTRSFGVVYPSTGFDLASFESLLKKNGKGTIAQAVEYDPTNSTQVGEQMPTFVGKLKQAGVTSVVLFGTNTVITPLMAAATTQDYHPEWIFTGTSYQDFDLFARAYDKDQMQHAFGLSTIYPGNQPNGSPPPPYLLPFTWYYGTTQGADGGNIDAVWAWIYQSIQYAGPTLTAENVKKGRFATPAVGGAAQGIITFTVGYGKTTGMPTEQYATLGSDKALVWWDGDTTGISQLANFTGKGVFRYMDNARRYSYKDFPTTEPKFFGSTKDAVYVTPLSAQYPGGVVPTAVPCTGCPSSGGGS